MVMVFSKEFSIIFREIVKGTEQNSIERELRNFTSKTLEIQNQ